MHQLTAQQKHDILVHYLSRSTGETASSILAAHGVSAAPRTLWSWQQQWDGTPQSLQHKAVSGRPRTLSTQQVRRHIAAPIRNANRAHRAVRYTKLLPQVRRATGAELSLRTLQRYGKEEAGGQLTRGKKRTAEECECARTCLLLLHLLLMQRAHGHDSACLCLTFSVPGAV